MFLMSREEACPEHVRYTSAFPRVALNESACVSLTTHLGLSVVG